MRYEDGTIVVWDSKRGVADGVYLPDGTKSDKILPFSFSHDMRLEVDGKDLLSLPIIKIKVGSDGFIDHYVPHSAGGYALDDDGMDLIVVRVRGHVKFSAEPKKKDQV